MAFTPIDPTKAEVRVTGTAPNQALDFYIPRGAKGEPGGFANFADIGSTKLDDFKTNGIFKQTNGSYVNILNGYPVAGGIGTLTVENAQNDSSRLEQTWTRIDSNMSITSQAFWKRTYYAGTWSVWRTYSSTRVDNTAGRAIYQWDDLNNREQLIYGDTGMRSIADLSTTITAGSVFVRRSGQVIMINLVNLRISDASGSPTILTLPTGFRPQMDTYSVSINDASKRVYASGSGALMILNHSDPNTVYGASMTALTTNNWPTTLPGTASGSIPNL